MSKNSGPAFPQHYGDKPTGMSRRDYFASLAVNALIFKSSDHDGGWDPAAVAAGAYLVADAMIEESAK